MATPFHLQSVPSSEQHGFFPYSAVALCATAVALAVLNVNTQAVAAIVICSLLLIAGCLLLWLWRTVHVYYALYQGDFGHEVTLAVAVDLYILTLLAAAAGAYLFWLFDSLPDRNTQWALVNTSSSAWEIYVNLLYASGMTFGTGGITQFVPSSIGTKLYAWFIIGFGVLNSLLVAGIAAGDAYERAKARRKRRKAFASQLQGRAYSKLQ